MMKGKVRPMEPYESSIPEGLTLTLISRDSLTTVCAFSKDFLSKYDVLGTFLSTGNTAVNKNAKLAGPPLTQDGARDQMDVWRQAWGSADKTQPSGPLPFLWREWCGHQRTSVLSLLLQLIFQVPLDQSPMCPSLCLRVQSGRKTGRVALCTLLLLLQYDQYNSEPAFHATGGH